MARGFLNLGGKPPKPPEERLRRNNEFWASLCNLLAAKPLLGGFGGLAPQVSRTPSHTFPLTKPTAFGGVGGPVSGSTLRWPADFPL
jgi:hypothetical protein